MLIGTTRALSQIEEEGLADRPRTLVKLQQGFDGYFYRAVCFAYCSDSLIVWSEGRYHYIISLKAGRKTELIESATLAIRNSVAQRK